MKYTLLLLSMLIAVCTMAQQATFDNLRARNVLRPPAYNSLSNATAAGSQPGNMVYVHSGADSGVWVRSWDNSRWVKVNNNDDFEAIPVGEDWRASPGASDNQWLAGCYAKGLFVIVGTGTNRCATSPDGVTWTNRTLGSGGQLLSIAYGNNIFVTVGGFGTSLATSTNGTSWTVRTIPGVSTLNSVVFGKGLFITSSTSSRDSIYRSIDGISWSGHRIPSDNLTEDSVFTGLYFLRDSFYMHNIVGSSILSSLDGITWQKRSSNINTIPGDFITGQRNQRIAFDGQYFSTFKFDGDSIYILKSPDLANWTYISIPNSFISEGPSNVPTGLVFYYEKYIIFGSGSQSDFFLYSYNGLQWYRSNNFGDHTGQHFRTSSIVKGKGLLVAVSNWAPNIALSGVLGSRND